MKFQVGRKIFHLTGLIFPLLVLVDGLSFLSLGFKEDTRSILFYFFLLGVILMGVVEFLRFRYSSIQNLFIKIVGPLLKEKELYKTHGSLPYFAALGVVIGFFPKEVAVLSVAFLILGDPSAAYFGAKYGKRRFPNGKSVEGSIAFALTCFIVGMIFIGIYSFLEETSLFHLDIKSILILFISSIVASVGELLSQENPFDDNLIVPIVSAISLTLLLSLFYSIPLENLFYSPKDLLFPTV